MQQLAKQGGEWQPPSQTAAKVSKARTPSLCTLEMVALPAWERKGSPPPSLSLSGWSKPAQHCGMLSVHPNTTPEVAHHSRKIGSNSPN